MSPTSSHVCKVFRFKKILCTRQSAHKSLISWLPRLLSLALFSSLVFTVRLWSQSNVDWHHIGSSPNGACPVHEWYHRSTSGTHSSCLQKLTCTGREPFLNSHIRGLCDILCHIRLRWRLRKILSTGREPKLNKNRMRTEKLMLTGRGLNYFSYYFLFYLLHRQIDRVCWWNKVSPSKTGDTWINFFRLLRNIFGRRHSNKVQFWVGGKSVPWISTTNLNHLTKKYLIPP